MTAEVAARRGVLLAFARLSHVGPGRLRQLARHPDPLDAWAAVRAGRAPVRGLPPDQAGAWAIEARDLDPLDEVHRHEEAGVRVAALGDPDYPAALAADRAAPAIAVWRGEWPAEGPRCAIVGTRRCTRYGRDVARLLGHDLADAGVAVVSGLALGIDGAAHAGVLAAHGAPPIAAVAGGLDRIYPARHRDLWEQVAARGVVVGEAPLGIRPEPWRFPARNRIIAALGHVLVVVESGERGGSMVTVTEAARRARDVLAVPGPVTSAGSAGTNQLLSEGCAPCRDATDVLVALNLEAAQRAGAVGGAEQLADADPDQPDRGLAGAVLDCLGAERRSFDALVSELGAAPSMVAVAVEELLATGEVVGADGWFEVAR